MAGILGLVEDLGGSLVVNGFFSSIFYIYYKAKLDKAAKTYEVTFSRLHEKRSEAIEKTYASLVTTLESLMAYFASPGPPSEEASKSRRESFIDNFSEFQKEYSRKRIYLPKAICARLVSIDHSMSTELAMIDLVAGGETAQNYSEKIKIFTNLKALINTTLLELEDQMRIVLCGTE